MRPLKRHNRFLLILVLVLGALLAPWPGLSEAYAAFFRTCENMVLRDLWRDGEASFLPLDIETLPAGTPLPSSALMSDTVLRLRNRRAGVTGFAFNNSRQIGYIPTALFLTLIAATPLPWRRKGPALVWGLLLIYGYALLRVGVYVWNEFAQDSPIRLYAPEGLWAWLLNYAARHVLPAGTYVVAVGVWIVVTFRRADIAAFRT